MVFIPLVGPTSVGLNLYRSVVFSCPEEDSFQAVEMNKKSHLKIYHTKKTQVLIQQTAQTSLPETWDADDEAEVHQTCLVPHLPAE